MTYRSTKEVAELLGISAGRLKNAVWDGRVPSPRKLGGVYAWSDRDVHRASWVLRHRDAGDVLSGAITTLHKTAERSSQTQREGAE